jgi:hypothetical protein
VPRTTGSIPGASREVAEPTSAAAQYEYDPGLAGRRTRTKGTYSHFLEAQLLGKCFCIIDCIASGILDS